MSDDKFDVYFSNGSDGGLYNLESEINNHVTIVSNLRKMKKLREKVIGEMEKGQKSTEKSRVNLFKELGPLINNWKGQYPDFGKLLRHKEMDWLLMKYVEFIEMNKVIKTNLLSFVIECGYKDKPEINKDNKPLLHRTTPLHHAARSNKSYVISDLCKIYDRFDVDYIGCTPFHVACMEGCYNVVEKFLELGQDPNCPLQKSVVPPLHLALYNNQKNVAELLLKNGANPNLADEDGLMTPLHTICLRECDDDLAELFFKMCDDSKHSLLVEARNKWDRTPLHFAVFFNNKKAAKLLLKRGANPNLADEDGLTPLHAICSRKFADDFDELFFKMCGDSKHPLQVDSRNKSGDTPLHLAVCNINDKAVKLLLKRGANPNLADEDGLTPLHFICSRECGDDFTEQFFQMSDDSNRPLQVDARNKSDQTPLHLALFNNNKKAAKLLLKRGADPNVADVKGQTPLHFICMNKTDAADMAETLFQICDDRHQLVQVDTKDKSGWTPLQWAVAYLRPNLVEVLLDHGAKLSNFVFPTMNHFNLGFVLMLDKTAVHAKLKDVFDLRAVVKCLEKRGYKLKLQDIQTIKKLFDEYEVFKKWPNLDQRWYDKEEFSSEAKNIEMCPNQSLYDLVRSPPAKAEEILPNEDYYHKLVSSTEWSKLSEEFRIASVAQLCEVMARGLLYKRRALASLVKLTGNKLPILGYEMIIELLTNKDMWHIYLASSNENKRSL